MSGGLFVGVGPAGRKPYSFNQNVLFRLSGSLLGRVVVWWGEITRNWQLLCWFRFWSCYPTPTGCLQIVTITSEVIVIKTGFLIM